MGVESCDWKKPDGGVNFSVCFLSLREILRRFSDFSRFGKLDPFLYDEPCEINAREREDGFSLKYFEL